MGVEDHGNSAHKEPSLFGHGETAVRQLQQAHGLQLAQLGQLGGEHLLGIGAATGGAQVQASAAHDVHDEPPAP